MVPAPKMKGKANGRDYDSAQNRCCHLDPVAAAPGHFWATMVFSASCRHHWHVGFPPALIFELHVPCLSAQGTREEDDVVSEDLVQQDVQVNKHV